MTKQRKIIDIIKTLKRAPPDHDNDLFLPINIDDYRLSIQASKDHHCTPKINNLDATEYTHFEVALYFKKPPSRFLKYRIYQNLQTWLDYEDDSSETGMMLLAKKTEMMLFAQIPYDKVNELYDILKTQKVLELIAKSVPIKNDTYVIALGNAFDGITLHGPFDSIEKATTHAEYIYKKTYEKWDIIKLTPVEE